MAGRRTSVEQPNDMTLNLGPRSLMSGSRRWTARVRGRRVVVVAPERLWGELHAARWRAEARDVIVLAGLEDVPEVAGTSGAAQLRLRRCDRVEWLAGWHRGPGGDAFAACLERYAAAGGFGAARHVFAVVAA